MITPPSVSTNGSSSETHVGRSAAELKGSFVDHLTSGLGRTLRNASPHDVFTALARTVRDRVYQIGTKTIDTASENGTRTVAYFSAEYLPGPHLMNDLIAMRIVDPMREALHELGLDLDQVAGHEVEPGLGNGGLGRLASCYMDSLATLGIPALGYGIRYEFGIFDQKMSDGWQTEITDKWLRWGNPWEIVRPDVAFQVKFGGHTETVTDGAGGFHVVWHPGHVVMGVAYDTPILGYDTDTVNTLRLWKAEAVESFELGAFNRGNYYEAVHEKTDSENITKVLYPNDEVIAGKILRLEQQFFFVSCSLRDLVRAHLAHRRDLRTFHEHYAIQLNDTHPSIAVAELMRVLVDEHRLSWDEAWETTRNTFAYTNHTLLPEALEKWPVSLFANLLPRHLEIVYEINRRFLDEVRARFPGDDDRIRRMSIIDEDGERYVRMAYLATIGSHRVNGVAALHSELVKTTILRDFAELWPEKFCNVTNGVTPRRFIAVANPPLAKLIEAHVDDSWLKHLDRMDRLEPLADDAAFRQAWAEAKLAAKRRLAGAISSRTGVHIDAHALFDLQVKRIHEYKRQHLSALYIISRYLRIKADPSLPTTPRAFIFGGKAAPGYFMAKLIIKFINSIADVVNNDPVAHGKLAVAFFPDYNVKNAMDIYPAADLSEQISLAGKEASGTGNMKLAMNGALTIGTLDGANIEIRDAVGHENFFSFGLDVDGVRDLKSRGYHPHAFYEQNADLRAALDFVSSGALAGGDTSLFRPLVDNLLGDDPYLVLADFQSYAEAQARVDVLHADPVAWTRMSILNAARMGKFSSDRSIRDYAALIWNVTPGFPA
jgi:starch phosphorylase